MSYAPPPPPPDGYSAPQSNQKAMWALILGVLGLVCCGPFTGVPAIILGKSAQQEVAASAGAQSGDGMARAAVVLGWISIALTVLLVILVVGLFAVGASFSTSVVTS